MGLEKAIEHGKEHRKPYYDSRAFVKSCRNHGSCEWCREARLYQIMKEIEKMENKMIDYINNEED